jgi:hypothetical protein
MIIIITYRAWRWTSVAVQLSWTTRCRLFDFLAVQHVLLDLLVRVRFIVFVSLIRRRVRCGCCSRSGTRGHIRTRNAARASSPGVERWR